MFPDAPPSLSSDAAATSSAVHVYVGTYTGDNSRGIYRFRFDLESGAVSPVELAAETTNPSFLASGPGGRFVYAVSEVSDFAGKKSGGVASFAVGPEDGGLTLINTQPSGGRGPCFVAVSPDGGAVLAANYSGGSVAALPAGADGRLAPPASVIQHAGSSVDRQRQKGPHAHSINVDPSGRFALAADLGLDKILVYRLDSAAGTLTPHDPPSAALPPGSGPRHLAFSPDGRFAYVCNEMGNSVTAFSWDAAAGVLRDFQTVSTLPAGFEGENTTAEVRVHPSGLFLYVSNRGDDSLAIFRVDPASGRLAIIGHESTQGEVPRGFNIDPSGSWLLAANQNSDSLVLFRIDSETGALESRGAVRIGKPVCVLFLPQRTTAE